MPDASPSGPSPRFDATKQRGKGKKGATNDLRERPGGRWTGEKKRPEGRGRRAREGSMAKRSKSGAAGLFARQGAAGELVVEAVQVSLGLGAEIG